MGLVLELTKVMAATIELSDEEEAEYREAQAKGWADDFLDIYWSNMDEVERTIDES